MSLGSHFQETFIQSLVDVVEKNISLDENSRQQFSRFFHLKKDGLSLQVCKDKFLSTLSISHQKMNSALERDKENFGITTKVTKRQSPTPSRGFAWTDEGQLFFQDVFQVNTKPLLQKILCKDLFVLPSSNHE